MDEPQLTWNLVEDVRQVLEYPFMVNAFRAGAIVAVLAGLVGWFMVLRRQSFAGHTLAVVGFPGAAGAVLVGVGATYGLLAFAVVAALVIGLVPASTGRSYSEESAVTGTVNAFARSLRLESAVGDKNPEYRYERDVENFFRHSPAVVRNPQPET